MLAAGPRRLVAGLGIGWSAVLSGRRNRDVLSAPGVPRTRFLCKPSVVTERLRDLDKSQLGRAGELALALYALVTSNGQVELYQPVVDDDHVDLVGAIRGGLPKIGIQVKTADALDKHGQVEARASFPLENIRDDVAFVYAVLLLDSVRIRTAWLIPSPDFNRLAYRHADASRVDLEFRAYPERPDGFSTFRIDPLQLGPALISRIRTETFTPDWLVSLTIVRQTN